MSTRPRAVRPTGDRRFGSWFLIATGFLVLVFLTGGSSRANVLSLPLLRPVAALLLAAALVSVRSEEVRAHRTPVLFLVAVAMAVLAQLVPLPPAVWMQLPHRELASTAATAAGLAGEWRPLSLVPTGTRNAAYSLLVPGAMLAAALHLTAGERRRLVLVLLGLGGAGIVLGVLQVSTSPSGTFYLYRLSTKFAPTGFFANPNHHAAFLAALLPMTAHVASRVGGRIGRVPKKLLIDAAAALVIVLTILLAGSRAGLLLAAVGIAAMPLAQVTAGSLVIRSRALPLALGAAGFAVLVGVAMMAGRAAAIHRLLVGNAFGDLRLRVWPIIAGETGRYFPAGAGWGSFVETFQIAEPYHLLKPTFLNHAHNDWLEVVMGGGVMGLALLAFVLGWWLWSLIRLSRVERQRAASGWLGLAVIGIFGLSSMVDYPLRTPCLQVVFILSWLWVGDALRLNLGSVRSRQSIAAGPSLTNGMQ